jgi:hypothetical protein
MVALACTLIMKEAETERTGVPGQPGLHWETLSQAKGEKKNCQFIYLTKKHKKWW